MPKTEGMNKYVVFEEMPKAGQYAADDAFKAKWAQLIAVRDEVEEGAGAGPCRKDHPVLLWELLVTLYCNDAVYDLLNSIPMDELADLMIVSEWSWSRARAVLPAPSRAWALQRHTPPAKSASAAGSILLPSAATPHIPPCAHAAPALWRA